MGTEDTNEHIITDQWVPYFTGPGDLHISNRSNYHSCFYSVKTTGASPIEGEIGHELAAGDIVPRKVATGKQLYICYLRNKHGLPHKVVITDSA